MGSIMRQPLDTVPQIESLTAKAGDRFAWIDSLIWDQEARELHAGWLFCGEGQGGESALTSMYGALKAKSGSIYCQLMVERERWDSAKAAYATTTRVESAYLGWPVAVREAGSTRLEIKRITNHKLVEGRFAMADSDQGNMAKAYTQIFEADWTEEERLSRFYDQLDTRVQIPDHEAWTEKIWDMLVDSRQARPLASMGRFVGWDITLDESVLRNFLRRGIAARTIPNVVPEPKQEPVIA